MRDVNNTKHIKDLSDDVLAALVARHKVRMLGLTAENAPTQFTAIFHEYMEMKKSTNEKQEAKFERERRKTLLAYVTEHLTYKDELGELTEYVITQ